MDLILTEEEKQIILDKRKVEQEIKDFNLYKNFILKLLIESREYFDISGKNEFSYSEFCGIFPEDKRNFKSYKSPYVYQVILDLLKLIDSQLKN